MKKLEFLFACFFISFSGFSQTNAPIDNTPGYIKDPTIPAFTVYKAPDSTAFTKEDLHKKKPTLLMIFSPDCGHCQHETSVLLENFSHFKNAQILMFTWLPFSDMMSFYKNYKIANYPQITMAWDSKYFFLPYYHVQSYPMLIAYDKKGKFVKAFDGNSKIEEVWKALGNK